MTKQKITLDLVQATSIEQFRTESGQRKLYMHYWQLSSAGEWLYTWIDRHTDPVVLEKLIKKGQIYLMEGAYSSPKPESGST